MKIGECELAWTAVDGVAKAKHGVIGFADGAPVAVLFIERDHVIVVNAERLEIKKEGFLSVHPERGGGDKCSLNAVRSPFLQHHARRKTSPAFFVQVDGDGIKKILNFMRCGERFENRELFFS